MQERESLHLTDLTMCYLGPLVLLMLPGYRVNSPILKRTIREGILINGGFLVALLITRMLSSVPIFGILFGTLLVLLWMGYMAIVGWLIVQKYSDPYVQVPFLTAYADRMEWKPDAL